MSRTAEVVICGAGIAGVSAAYHLAKGGVRDVLIVDPLPPLSLTSDRSSEGYRNWWPDAEMVALMNRSIDLLEELARASNNVFRMNRRGYLYVTGDPEKVAAFSQRAQRIAALGAGDLRIHHGQAEHYSPAASSAESGADLLGPAAIRKHFPWITESAVAALHVRRAGWLSAQQLGMYLLEQAKQLGARLETGEVAGVKQAGGRVECVVMSSGDRVGCGAFVNAAGPYLKRVGGLLGVDLPVETELHVKVSFKDHLGLIDRNAPMTIWDDKQLLRWEAQERSALLADPETRWLAGAFPPGVHFRPEGAAENRTVLMLWDYAARMMEPVFPPPTDELYPEVVLRGLATMVPALQQYFGRTPRPVVDGGYYVKTPENRLLAGPLPVEGAFVIGALSGYGIMSSLAAGELLAAHLTAAPLPPYAPAFSPMRYADPAYRQSLSEIDTSGQL
ncbi:MAG: NAD(P)/FAD-dependent oxidoreductase [Anaerolineae bacterium]